MLVLIIMFMLLFLYCHCFLCVEALSNGMILAYETQHIPTEIPKMAIVDPVKPWIRPRRLINLFDTIGARVPSAPSKLCTKRPESF